jgi:hypothetical protein
VFAVLFSATVVVPCVRAASMLPPAPHRPKDFAFFKKDGVYHLFYIRHNDDVPVGATETELGHAVSTDLYHWTQRPPVLPVVPGSWEARHVWAPHVIEHQGRYWMLYTGVSAPGGGRGEVQSMGLAVSDDLEQWSRVSQSPVWTNEFAPWAWWQPRNSLMACRDPFVMPDPDSTGEFLMYYTVSPASDTLSTLIGVARTVGGDLSQWQDLGPLWETHRSRSYNLLTESPHVFRHGNRWYLMITTESGQPLSWFAASHPLGPWTYKGRLRNLLGYDTADFFASEVLQDGELDYFACSSGPRLEFKRIVWGAGDTFSLTEPALGTVHRMEWTRPSVNERQNLGLRILMSNGFAVDRGLEAFVRDANGVEMLAPLDSLGLPQRIEATGDTLVIRWFARCWPSGGERPMQLRVALTDGTASTGWLLVSPTASSPGSGGSGNNKQSQSEPPPDVEVETHRFEGFEEDTSGVARSTRMGGRPTGLRALEGGSRVAFDLQEPADARLEVFDLQGRRVVTLAQRRFGPGAHGVEWDGRDESGAVRASGLYFVRLKLPGRVHTARLFRRR